MRKLIIFNLQVFCIFLASSIANAGLAPYKIKVGYYVGVGKHDNQKESKRCQLFVKHLPDNRYRFHYKSGAESGLEFKQIFDDKNFNTVIEAGDRHLWIDVPLQENYVMEIITSKNTKNDDQFIESFRFDKKTPSTGFFLKDDLNDKKFNSECIKMEWKGLDIDTNMWSDYSNQG